MKKKKMTAGTVTLFVLEKIFELGMVPFEVFEATTSHGGFGKRTLSSALASAQRSGYIKKAQKKAPKKTAPNSLLALTPKGRLRLLSERCKLASRETKPVWDRRWRILIFDIPERKRYLRDYLRQHLRSFGFACLHKSVWVTPYHTPTDLIRLLWELRVKIYTRYILTEHMDYEKDLLRKFNLATSA